MTIAIHWFRQDLRLADNPALSAAARAREVLPIFILDDEAAGEDQMGAASRLWLHHSLAKLNASLGGNLAVFKGSARAVLEALIKAHPVSEIHWNRCYEPWRIARDQALKSWLASAGIDAQSHNGALLWEPWEVRKADGTPYRVFTPFYRKGCLGAPPPRQPLPAPKITTFKAQDHGLDALSLLPSIPWDAPVIAHWEVGESAAQARLAAFIKGGISDYKSGRNVPARAHVSRLSPHLHFGEISPNQAWWAAKSQDENADTFRSELGWREFSHSLLYHFPELRTQNWNAKFDAFEWTPNPAHLRAWQRGQTGIPIIDAGMRELWQTGYMHNRVRMIAASFLIKNLGQNWRAGEAWFWDTLFDADHANNAAGWQWVAGSGADAAPYFRVFNPVLQSEKFDPQGEYIRRFVPELEALADKYIHAPWRAPRALLDEAKITLGKDYPLPIVDLAQSRQMALERYQAIR